LSVLSHLISISISFSLSLLSFFFFSLSISSWYLVCKGNEKHAETETLMFSLPFFIHPLHPPLSLSPPLDPVLFASSCGAVGANPPSTTAVIRNEPTLDLRLTSISAAVEFSKNNNLLGLFLDTYLLVGSLWLNEALFRFTMPHQVKVPSLVRAVRDAGLLIAAYGTAENLASLVSSTQSIDGGAVDAVFQEGVLVFHDHFPRTWF